MVITPLQVAQLRRQLEVSKLLWLVGSPTRADRGVASLRRATSVVTFDGQVLRGASRVDDAARTKGREQ